MELTAGQVELCSTVVLPPKHESPDTKLQSPPLPPLPALLPLPPAPLPAQAASLASSTVGTGGFVCRQSSHTQSLSTCARQRCANAACCVACCVPAVLAARAMGSSRLPCCRLPAHTPTHHTLPYTLHLLPRIAPLPFHCLASPRLPALCCPRPAGRCPQRDHFSDERGLLCPLR